MRHRIEFDNERCVWCRSCELICSLFHEGECNPSLSRIKISIDLFEGKAEGHVCKQCEDPECLKACPVEAIRIDEKIGIPVILEDKCVGCGLCSKACPYNDEGKILFLNPTKKVYMKCDLCSGIPQCVQVCPSKAIKYET